MVCRAKQHGTHPALHLGTTNLNLKHRSLGLTPRSHRRTSSAENTKGKKTKVIPSHKSNVVLYTRGYIAEKSKV